jgi:nitrite reductase (NO-forming)
VEFKVETTGNYLLVDHSIFRAFNKGALGTLAVGGVPDSVVYSGRQFEGVYQPEGGAVQTMPSAAAAAPAARTRAEQIAMGERVYAQNCAACHQPTGAGLAGAFPPLAGSDFLNADTRRAVGVVLHGLSGPVTVNGAQYNSLMPALSLNDEDAANVLTYVYSQWGNNGTRVTPALVREVRASGGQRVDMGAH